MRGNIVVKAAAGCTQYPLFALDSWLIRARDPSAISISLQTNTFGQSKLDPQDRAFDASNSATSRLKLPSGPISK